MNNNYKAVISKVENTRILAGKMKAIVEDLKLEMKKRLFEKNEKFDDVLDYALLVAVSRGMTLEKLRSVI